MPLELSVWRIDSGLQRVDVARLDLESRLEDILARDISVASPAWMVIGRQVPTPWGKFIDLLCIDGEGKETATLAYARPVDGRIRYHMHQTGNNVPFASEAA